MKKVLFVCIHNSGRSQMAEALFNYLAKGQVLALSAGTMPADSINLQAIEAMAEMGIDITGSKPKLMTMQMIKNANRAITMGCNVAETCPATFVPTEDWGLDDPAGQPLEQVRRIRDQIEAKVKVLIQDL
ncbi:MAG: arsenate reductase ArsC [Chloroflexi bacterium]|nr:arsenate reductase ArsC [Chloroflexota bacterium]MBT7080207.1 arsenate reductase ArsC [Chloroflexota bacterium]MBT7290153.1 arsenate reductase ArsC [Chloroflexota bacterium]